MHKKLVATSSRATQDILPSTQRQAWGHARDSLRRAKTSWFRDACLQESCELPTMRLENHEPLCEAVLRAPRLARVYGDPSRKAS